MEIEICALCGDLKEPHNYVHQYSPVTIIKRVIVITVNVSQGEDAPPIESEYTKLLLVADMKDNYKEQIVETKCSHPNCNAVKHLHTVGIIQHSFQPTVLQGRKRHRFAYVYDEDEDFKRCNECIVKLINAEKEDTAIVWDKYEEELIDNPKVEKNENETIITYKLKDAGK